MACLYNVQLTIETYHHCTQHRIPFAGQQLQKDSNFTVKYTIHFRKNMRASKIHCMIEEEIVKIWHMDSHIFSTIRTIVESQNVTDIP